MHYIRKINKLLHAIYMSTGDFTQKTNGIITSKGYAFCAVSKPWAPLIFLGTEIKYSWILTKLMHRRNSPSYWMNIGSRADIYINNLNKLYEVILSKNTQQFSLILSDGDWSITSSNTLDFTIKILSDDNLKYIFAQNVDVSVIPNGLKHKVKLIPIGLDIHTKRRNLSQTALIEYILMGKSQKERIQKILVDFKSSYSHPIREAIVAKIADNPNFEILNERRDQIGLWDLYHEYLAVLSPPGGGLDCHRTWEALVFGAVPIVLKNHLADLHEASGAYLIDTIEDLLEPDLIQKLAKHRRWIKLRPPLYRDYINDRV